MYKSLFYLSEKTGKLYYFDEFMNWGRGMYESKFGVSGMDLPKDEYPYFQITLEDMFSDLKLDLWGRSTIRVEETEEYLTMMSICERFMRSEAKPLAT
jgi:hypothetical protein